MFEQPKGFGIGNVAQVPACRTEVRMGVAAVSFVAEGIEEGEGSSTTLGHPIAKLFFQLGRRSL